MNASFLLPRFLMAAGLSGMLFAAVDRLEGSLIILIGVGMPAVGAFLGRNWRQILLFESFALVAFGVSAMLVLSWLGDIGGNFQRSIWWALLIPPYPIGLLTALVGGILGLVEFFIHDAVPKTHSHDCRRSTKLNQSK